MAVKDIRKGCNLAYQIKEWDIPHYDFDKYIHQIEDYRLRVKAANETNESLLKSINEKSYRAEQIGSLKKSLMS